MENQVTENIKYIDITPLKKTKRALVFLADLFVHLILSFVIYNVSVVPIWKASINYDALVKEQNQASTNIANVFYRNEVLFKDPDGDFFDLTNSISYTYGVWLSYYVIDEEEPSYVSNKIYAHKEQNEVFKTFFKSIRNKEDSYISFVKHYDNNEYFLASSSNIELKSNYKSMLIPFYDSKDELGGEGKKLFENIRDGVYLPIYGELMADIEANDLTFEGMSYIANRKIVSNFEDTFRNMLFFSLVIAHSLSWSILFILLPFVLKRGRTLSMLFMRNENIDVNKLSNLTKGQIVIRSLYIFISTFFINILLPLSYIGINYVFTIFSLIIFAGFSFVFALISLIFMLFNPLNRTITDFLSRSVYITSEDLDEIYRSRGYTI